MTRVIMSLAVLEYCEGMAALVHELVEKPAIRGVEPRSRKSERFPARKDVPAFRLDGLLQPPRVEALEPYLFPAGDRAESIVYIAASGEYGVMSVYITLEDEWGNQIESGFALRDEVEPGADDGGNNGDRDDHAREDAERADLPLPGTPGRGLGRGAV